MNQQIQAQTQTETQSKAPVSLSVFDKSGAKCRLHIGALCNHKEWARKGVGMGSGDPSSSSTRQEPCRLESLMVDIINYITQTLCSTVGGKPAITAMPSSSSSSSSSSTSAVEGYVSQFSGESGAGAILTTSKYLSLIKAVTSSLIGGAGGGALKNALQTLQDTMDRSCPADHQELGTAVDLPTGLCVLGEALYLETAFERVSVTRVYNGVVHELRVNAGTMVTLAGRVGSTCGVRGQQARLGPSSGGLEHKIWNNKEQLQQQEKDENFEQPIEWSELQSIIEEKDALDSHYGQITMTYVMCNIGELFFK